MIHLQSDRRRCLALKTKLDACLSQAITKSAKRDRRVVQMRTCDGQAVHVVDEVDEDQDGHGRPLLPAPYVAGRRSRRRRGRARCRVRGHDVVLRAGVASLKDRGLQGTIRSSNVTSPLRYSFDSEFCPRVLPMDSKRKPILSRISRTCSFTHLTSRRGGWPRGRRRRSRRSGSRAETSARGYAGAIGNS